MVYSIAMCAPISSMQGLTQHYQKFLPLWLVIQKEMKMWKFSLHTGIGGKIIILALWHPDPRHKMSMKVYIHKYINKAHLPSTVLIELIRRAISSSKSILVIITT